MTTQLTAKTFSTTKFKTEVQAFLNMRTFNVLTGNVYEMFSDDKYKNLVAYAERVNKVITLTIV
jgi:hypothetical protein